MFGLLLRFDRADATVTTLLAIVKQLLDDPALRTRLADHLRDEFTDIARMTRDEIRDSE